VRSQELHCEQADQPKAKNRKPLAERRLRKPDALQRYCPENRKRGCVIGNAFRYRRAQVRRYTHKVSMCAIRRDTLADCEAAYTWSNIHNMPHVAIAHHYRLLKSVAHGPQSCNDAICAYLVKRHAYLLRLPACLFD
jgi:hypothetical protein